jgi:lipopolysaccharide/colanic/teichoic acid biosynthesis glycosyltransferase
MADFLIPDMQLSSTHPETIAESESSLHREVHSYERVLKRFIDTAGALVLLVIFCPVLVGLALLIRVIDGAPVLYRRRVVGTAGEFDAFKFRTMCRHADAMLAADPILHQAFTQKHKLKADPRVTKLGSILRKYSLDELPQLFNVLLGQMSLVGPRMVTAPELEKYGQYQKLLLTMKPGITGYWQVHGRQDVSYAERVRMDIQYITRWRVKTDLEILVLTPLRVLSGRGAY